MLQWEVFSLLALNGLRMIHEVLKRGQYIFGLHSWDYFAYAFSGIIASSLYMLPP